MTTQSGTSGTRASLVGASLDDGHAFRDGRLRIVRTAERVRNFPLGDDKQRAAVSVGGAEHLGLPAAYPRLQEVNVYLGWFGPFARPMQAGALVGSVATRLPGVREALQFAGERLAALAEGPEAGTTPGGQSHIVAQAYDAGRRAGRRGPPARAATGTRSPPTSWPGRRARSPAAASRAPARSGRWRRSGSPSSSAAARPPGSAAQTPEQRPEPHEPGRQRPGRLELAALR